MRPPFPIWLLVALAGCGDDGGKGRGPGQQHDSADTDVADADADSDADSDTDADTDADADTDVPTDTAAGLIVSASLRDPERRVHYARWLDVVTAEPATLHVVWHDAGTGHRLEVDTTEARTTHEVAVIGLRPDGSYDITVTATAASGPSTDDHTLHVDEEPLLSPWPRLDVLSHDPSRMEPGFTLIQINRLDYSTGYLIAFDDELQPVWAQVDLMWQDVRRTDAGTVFGTNNGQVVEQSFMGTVLRRYDNRAANAIDIPYLMLHHEAYPLSDGSFLSLAHAFRDVSNYPTSYADPTGPRQEATIRSSVATRIAEDGTVLMHVDMADVGSPTRIGFDSLAFDGGWHDWDHCNGIVPYGAPGWFVVSMRHQDAVVKASQSGEVGWILGDPAGWPASYDDKLLEPVGTVVWPYHQHHPDWHDDGRLIVFDNHNHGHTPYTPPPVREPHARVVEYRVDEAAMTVEMLNSWETFGGARLFSGAVGSAMELPVTGNVLADFGWVTYENAATNPQQGRGTASVRLIEIDRDRPDEPALDVRLYSSYDRDPRGWISYRATRIPALGEGIAPQPR